MSRLPKVKVRIHMKKYLASGGIEDLENNYSELQIQVLFETGSFCFEFIWQIPDYFVHILRGFFFFFSSPSCCGERRHMQSASGRSGHSVGQLVSALPPAAEESLPQFLLPACDNRAAGVCQAGVKVKRSVNPEQISVQQTLESWI